MTIHQYDFDVPDESKRHSIVEKNGADEGSIAFADGRIYFVQGDMENGDMIYRVKCDGGVRRQFTYGSLFALSGNKEYMAINAESGAAASSTGSEKLRIYEMDSGNSIPVSNEFGAQEFVWSRDGSRLYYFENRLSGDEENAEEGSSKTMSIRIRFGCMIWLRARTAEWRICQPQPYSPAIHRRYCILISTTAIPWARR